MDITYRRRQSVRQLEQLLAWLLPAKPSHAAEAVRIDFVLVDDLATKSFSTFGRRMPPSIFNSGRPSYRFASITQMPAAVMAMWSMLAFEPGIRRSCSTAIDADTSESSRAPRRSSPTAPVAHAFVLCFSSDRATAMPPSLPHF